MIKAKKDIFIVIAVAVCLLIAFLTKISGYLFMESLQEAKFVAAAIGMTNIFDIFYPQLNGFLVEEFAPLYYLILNISSLIFGRFTEFSARFPSVIVYLTSFLISYLLIRRMTNKKYAVITSVTAFSSTLLILFATVSSPYMFASLFSVCAILSAVTAIFSTNKRHKQWYFFWFWAGVTLSVLSAGLRELLLPLFSVIPLFLFFRKKGEFFAPVNFFSGLMIMCGVIYSGLILSCKVHDSNCFSFIQDFLKTTFVINFSEKHYLSYYKNYAIAFVLGFMPWIFSFCSMIASYIARAVKSLKNKCCIVPDAMTNEQKFFVISLWCFIISVCVLICYPDYNYAKLIPSVFFASMLVSYYWYKYVNFDIHKISINFSSLFYYSVLLIFTISGILSYFFLSSVQKTYVVPLLPPVICVTLFVAIPGIIAVCLKRKFFNYTVHVLSSILFFFLLTGLFFNYVNSFGENDLVNFSIKAQKDGARLATYDIPNKYSMSYYYKGAVVFNQKLSAEEIFSNYGNTAEVYVVLKLSDLAYFDKFFVYEIVATGRQYCEITNIKYLPKDEVAENPDVLPTEER